MNIAPRLPHTAGATGPWAGKRHHIMQGEFVVTDDPAMLLTTVLGSCVAACIQDREAGVGGMNHFLLPGEINAPAGQEAERQGVHMMELLLNALFQKGAMRNRLEARLFGGATMFAGLTDIGAQNAAFAERFLAHEGIRTVRGSLGGRSGRRVEFRPVSGEVRAQRIGTAEASVERVKRPAPVVSPPQESGNVELF